MQNVRPFVKFSGWSVGSFFLMVLFSACVEDPPETFQGYVEGEFVYVASPIGGRLEELNVRRGQSVTEGAVLFKLEQDFEEAVVQEASKKLKQAMDRLANLKKGKRPSEIQTIEARLKKAKAGLKLAEIEYNRRIELTKKEFISKERLDRARTVYDQQLQQVREITAELKTASLGARPDEIKVAQAEVKAERARLAQAQWNLDQKTQMAKTSGIVFDTIHYKGEWVPPGRPVVSLLPPENIKVRFFVPERKVGQISLGQKVFVSFDGGGPIPAKVSFISPRAQYTPPVIYSSHSRAKLVFMVEAAPDMDSAHSLHPGQPVDVRRTLKESPHDR